MKETCSECSKNLSTYMDLRTHVMKFHPTRLNELAPTPRYQKNLACDVCFARFRSNESLKRHIQDVHSSPGEEDTVQPLKQNSNTKETLSCPECEFISMYRTEYKKHIREKHGKLSEISTSRSSKLDKRCPLCSYINPNKNLIVDHFTQDHRIKLQTKIFNFTNHSKFLEWKNSMEKDTTSRYVQSSKSVTDCGKRTTYRYACHRSGYYRNLGKGSRKVKYKGSNKINGFCPSELLVVCDENGSEVQYTKTHIGHSNEIQRITLTHEERDYLASKIASKTPFDKIIEEQRISKSNEMSVDRLQLLTRKDLYNIAKRYKIKESAVFWDEKDIDSWARDTEGVIFYKGQGTLCEQYSFLNVDDFVLIVMNASQKEILDCFYRDLICISSLASINHQFDLTTIMVRDDALSGFPCAFMFSKRTDERIMEFYFSCLKEKIGKCNVKALMTDLTDVHYDAWANVMGRPQRRLYCSWDIDKAWRAHLNKIKSTEQRRSVYTALKNLQTESIEHNYKKMLKDFLEADSVDVEFRRNFATLFLHCDKLWACCYRVEDGINEDSQLQQMHDHLKYICTYGKKQKPLSQVLNAVLKMASDNLINRKIILNSNETIYHLNLIQKRHRDSYLGTFDSIITVDEGWHVPSFAELNESHQLYFVQEVLKKCGCNYSCFECHACIHQFACSCIDHLVEGNMCKHIHLVIRCRDGKKHFILDEGSGNFKDMKSEDEDEQLPTNSAKPSRITDQFISPRQSRLPTISEKYSKDSTLVDHGACTSMSNFIRNTIEASIPNDCDDIHLYSSADSELKYEQVIEDGIIDTNNLEASIVPSLTGLSNNSIRINFPTSNSRLIDRKIKDFDFTPKIELENKRNELIKKITTQINQIQSSEEMEFLENILSKIDAEIEAFRVKST